MYALAKGLGRGLRKRARRRALPTAAALQIAPSLMPQPAWLAPFETGVWLWCTLVVRRGGASAICSHASRRMPLKQGASLGRLGAMGA